MIRDPFIAFPFLGDHLHVIGRAVRVQAGAIRKRGRGRKRRKLLMGGEGRFQDRRAGAEP